MRSLLFHLNWISIDSFIIIFLFNDFEAILPFNEAFLKKFLYITSKFTTLFVIEPIFL